MIPIRRVALAVVLSVFPGAAFAGQAPAASAPPLPPRVAELVKQLKDPDWDTRMEAATALGRLGAQAKPAIPNLLDALGDPEAAVRMKAIDAFMFMGTDAAETAPRLAPMLNDPDERVRLSAVVALPRVTPDRASTVPLLKKMLPDKAWMVRRRAALELIRLGAEVDSAVPVLREGIKDPIPSYRLEAIGTLASVAPPEERKVLVDLVNGYVKDPNTETRIEAIRVLSGMGASSVPALREALKALGQDRHVQAAAVRALGRIGPDAREALPELRELRLRKGVLMKTAEKSIASIEGKGPRVPEDRVGPVPPLAPLPSPSAAPSPSTPR